MAIDESSRMRPKRRLTDRNGVLMAAWLTLAAPGAAQADTPLYKRADAPVAQRVRDLLQRMTLAEKIAQLETSLPIPPVPGMPANPLPMGGIIANGKPLEYWPVTNRIRPSSTYSPTSARTPVLYGTFSRLHSQAR